MFLNLRNFELFLFHWENLASSFIKLFDDKIKNKIKLKNTGGKKQHPFT